MSSIAQEVSLFDLPSAFQGARNQFADSQQRLGESDPMTKIRQIVPGSNADHSNVQSSQTEQLSKFKIPFSINRYHLKRPTGSIASETNVTSSQPKVSSSASIFNGTPSNQRSIYHSSVYEPRSAISQSLFDRNVLGSQKVRNLPAYGLVSETNVPPQPTTSQGSSINPSPFFNTPDIYSSTAYDEPSAIVQSSFQMNLRRSQSVRQFSTHGSSVLSNAGPMHHASFLNSTPFDQTADRRHLFSRNVMNSTPVNNMPLQTSQSVHNFPTSSHRSMSQHSYSTTSGENRNKLEALVNWVQTKIVMRSVGDPAARHLVSQICDSFQYVREHLDEMANELNLDLTSLQPQQGVSWRSQVSGSIISERSQSSVTSIFTQPRHKPSFSNASDFITSFSTSKSKALSTKSAPIKRPEKAPVPAMMSTNAVSPVFAQQNISTVRRKRQQLSSIQGTRDNVFIEKPLKIVACNVVVNNISVQEIEKTARNTNKPLSKAKKKQKEPETQTPSLSQPVTSKTRSGRLVKVPAPYMEVWESKKRSLDEKDESVAIAKETEKVKNTNGKKKKLNETTKMNDSKAKKRSRVKSPDTTVVPPAKKNRKIKESVGKNVSKQSVDDTSICKKSKKPDSTVLKGKENNKPKDNQPRGKPTTDAQEITTSKRKRGPAAKTNKKQTVAAEDEPTKNPCAATPGIDFGDFIIPEVSTGARKCTKGKGLGKIGSMTPVLSMPLTSTLTSGQTPFPVTPEWFLSQRSPSEVKELQKKKGKAKKVKSPVKKTKPKKPPKITKAEAEAMKLVTEPQLPTATKRQLNYLNRNFNDSDDSD